MRIAKPCADLRWITPQPEEAITSAARLCYKSEPLTTEDNPRLIKNLIKNGHHAMLEHACASFHIITDRGIANELVRHRIASYAQESTRYCNYTKGKFNKEITFIEPSGLSRWKRFIWKKACKWAERFYFWLIYLGASPSLARCVLPTCTKTEIIITTNLREFRHICSLRALNLSGKAHTDMNIIALLMLTKLYRCAPNVFADLYKIKQTKESPYVPE